MNLFIANPVNTKLIVKKLTFISLLFINLIVSNASANPQDYRYQKAFKVQRLSLAEGLSQSVVNDVIQDSDGYIWLATEDGLNRFDSYDFKVYRHDHKNPNSLHENWVVSLLEEPNFGIWVGTNAGLSFFNPVSDSFIDFSEQDPDLKTTVHSFLLDQDLTIWIGTDNGLFYVDRNQEQFKVKAFVSDNQQPIDDEVFSMTESDSSLYVATSSCIYQIEKSTRKRTQLCDSKQLNILQSAIISTIKINNEFLWIGTTQGLYCFDTRNNNLTSYHYEETNEHSISDNIINDLVVDRKGALWIATRKGLNLYDAGKDEFEHYSHQNHSTNSLSANHVLSLYIDQQDLIWLGTYGGGVNILDPNQHQFEHILSQADVVGIGDNNTIHGIEKDRYENLWLASYGGGLIRYNLLTGEISRPLNHLKYDQYVYSLLIDQLNHLWIGALTELRIVDLETGNEIDTRFYLDGARIKAIDGVVRIHEDYNGDIWIGSQNGLFKVTSTSFKQGVFNINLRDITHNLPHSFTNYSTTISAIAHDKNGDFWFGGYAGLINYRVKENEWFHYRYDKNNPQSLSSNDVQVIYEDSLGFIWVGTADGLNRINRSEFDNGTFYFERITTYEGLPNNAIYGILEDDRQQLWMSTTLGLVKYIHKAVNMDVFRSADGLSSDEFNTGAYFSDSNGDLYFGSVDGITIVKNISNRIEQPKINRQHKIFFSSIKVGERNIDTYQINHSDSPTIIQYGHESAIDLSVVSMNFDKLGTQRYRYRVLGLNKNWNYLGTRHNMFIAGLPEGSYRLEIESQRAGEPWLAQAANLQIQVKTDFWRSSQAYYIIAFSILSLFIISLLLVARYYRQRVAKIDKKMSIEKLKTKELKADNEIMKSDLRAKQSEVASLVRKIELGERKLGVEKYRDATTGFYRLSYLYQVEEELLSEQGNAEDIAGFDCYKTLAVFELDDYAAIYNDTGPLAAAEFAAKVSMLMRQKNNSETQIFSVQNGMFLVLSNQNNVESFFDNMINLRYQIIRSEFEVANGISTSSKVSLSIMDITNSNIESKAELLAMIDLIIQAHRFSVTINEQSCVKIEINKKAGYFIDRSAKIDFELLQQQGLLLLSRL